MSEPTSTPENPSMCSTPCGEAVESPSVTRGEYDEDDVDLCACANAGVNVSPMSACTTRPPSSTPFLASPVPLLFDSPHSTPKACKHPQPDQCRSVPHPRPCGGPEGILACGGIHSPGMRNPYLPPAPAHAYHQVPPLPGWNSWWTWC